MNVNADGQPQISITLVHGTWPRGLIPQLSRLWGGGKYWFERGSHFWNALRSSLDANAAASSEINAYLWSGANSIIQRNQAARVLADRLAREKKLNPTVQQVIIAHSHGGNVALRTIHLLPKDFPGISIATVASPFVELRPAKGAARLRARINRYRKQLPVIVRYLLWPSPWLVRSVQFSSIRRQRKLQAASNLSGLRTGLFQHNLFVLRAIDDEASLVLAAGAIVNRIMTAAGMLWIWAWLVVIPLLAVWAIAAWLSGTDMGSSFMDMSRYIPYGDVLNYLFAALYISTPIVILPIVLGYSFRVVYGRELWRGCWSCEVNSQSVPDHTGRQVVALTLPQMSGKGKRHMLYNAPECADLIVRWFMRGSPFA